VSAALESARSDWEDGSRRLAEAARDPRQGERLYAQVDVLIAELTRRLGSTFSLQELVEAYAGAERWAGEALAEHVAAPGWPRTLAISVDTAFHRYQRGALDYEP
jgi:hypothetical protein